MTELGQHPCTKAMSLQTLSLYVLMLELGDLCLSVSDSPSLPVSFAAHDSEEEQQKLKYRNSLVL